MSNTPQTARDWAAHFGMTPGRIFPDGSCEIIPNPARNHSAGDQAENNERTEAMPIQMRDETATDDATDAAPPPGMRAQEVMMYRMRHNGEAPPSRAKAAAPVLRGHDLFVYRMKHAGKSPADVAAEKLSGVDLMRARMRGTR
jgi:hypothetical protein